jgi:hypothetical protein
MPRRFPLPWSSERIPGGYVVKGGTDGRRTLKEKQLLIGLLTADSVFIIIHLVLWGLNLLPSAPSLDFGI